MQNYRILLREIKEIKRYILCSWIRRFSIVEVSLVPNLICLFSEIPIVIPGGFFIGIDKLIQKFIWKIKICRIAIAILKTKTMLEE